MDTTARKIHLASLTVLILFSCGLYVNTLNNDFMWDDTYVISQNRYIASLKNIPLFFAPHYWNDLHPIRATGQYLPIRTTTFAIDYALWKSNPTGYHATNMILNTVTVLLVYCFIWRLAAENNNRTVCIKRDGITPLPLLTALIFAAHPAHTESVTYIKNRSELLALLFCLCAFLLFMAYPQMKRAGSRRLFFLGSLFCYLMAVISKEMALTLPLLLIVYSCCFPQKHSLQDSLIRVIPFWGVTAFYFWFQHAFLKTAAMPGNSLHINGYQHLLAVLKTIGWYMKILILPVRLNAEHVFSIPDSSLDPYIVISFFGMIIIVLIAVYRYKENRLLFFALSWILLTFLPASNIIFLASRLLAEQRLYIPSLGFCLLTALAISRIMARQSVFSFSGKTTAPAILLTLLLLGVYSVITVRRNADWRDPLTFCLKTVADSPNSCRAHLNLGVVLAEKGRLEEAVDHYRTALDIKPDYALAYYKIGNVLMKQEKLKESMLFYAKALSIDPAYAHTYNNMGVALMKQGQIDRAIQYYSQALALTPDYVDALNNMGAALANQGNFTKAAGFFSRALAINPEFKDARENLNRCLELMQNTK